MDTDGLFVPIPTLPEKYPDPFTESVCDGDEVPTPRKPLLLIESAGVDEVANVEADEVAR
jgi:hypothetical protein